jgi:hypothetical protein
MTVGQMREYCLRLGINHDVEMLAAYRGEEDMVRAWQRLQAKARKSYRGLMEDHHPDHGGDPELCKRLSEAWNAIKSLMPSMVRPPPRPPPPPRNAVWWSATESTTTTGTVNDWRTCDGGRWVRVDIS